MDDVMIIIISVLCHLEMRIFSLITLVILVSVAPMQSEAESRVECGLQQSARAKNRRRNKNKNAEIVGGGTARVGDYPWQISLLYKGKQHCGGTIISSNWVLTAGHCLALRGPKEVRVGGQFWYNGNSYKVIEEVIHPGYEGNTMKNDIALARVAGPIKFTPGNSAGQGAVWPACLPKPGTEPSGQVLATGWGAVQENGQKSDKLKVVSLSILSPMSCRRYMYYVPELQICAGFDRGGRDTCQGDSGGPLIKVESDKASVVGIVSNGNGCARPGFPGIYTKVRIYIPWIFSVVKKNP
ncbi:trypsin-1-like [Brevipalpus obovatus]|uniref:trypsin-1-like n=1 Tax=Brevipalpus obovatus TaxID=246614 RepID=UPI003D9E39AD